MKKRSLREVRKEFSGFSPKEVFAPLFSKSGNKQKKKKVILRCIYSYYEQMSKRRFLFGAGMLAALSIAAKLIGVFYRLPLTNILGAEGMGLYQMIFPVYSLLLAFIAGGIPSSVAKCVSELATCGMGDEAKRALKYGMILPISLGVLAATLLVIFRNRISAIQGNEAAGMAYIAIAPAIIFYGVIASVRGYFQGMNNLLPGGISQLIEQVAKVIFGLSLAAALSGMGVSYAVFGALIGVTLSEVAAALYLWIRYVKRSVGKTALERPIGGIGSLELCTEAGEDVVVRAAPTASELMRRIYSVALPVTLGSLVMPLSQAVDSFLVINLLSDGGLDASAATSLFGLFAGPVSSLIGLPSVITAALAAALLPEIAARKSRNLDISDALSSKMSAALVVIVPVVAVFAIAPEPILRILYSGGLDDVELGQAAVMLRIESVNVLLLGVIQISTAAMQGINKAYVPAICLVAGAVMKVTSVMALLPVVGITGAAISTVICYAVTCAIDIVCLRHAAGPVIRAKRGINILFSVAAFTIAMLLYFPLSGFVGEMAALPIAFILASGAYFLVIAKTKCILLSEILS